MRFHLAFLSVFIAATSAAAETVKLSGQQIMEVLSDRVVLSTDPHDVSQQLFQKAGATFFSRGSNQTQGLWKVVGNKYCSVWPPSENWVCYDVMKNGDVVQFMAPSGNVSDWKLSK